MIESLISWTVFWLSIVKCTPVNIIMPFLLITVLHKKEVSDYQQLMLFAFSVKYCRVLLTGNKNADESVTVKDVSRAMYEACWHAVVGNLDLEHLVAGLDDVMVSRKVHITTLAYFSLISLVANRCYTHPPLK